MKHHRPKGFTLIDLIVSSTIIVVMFTFVLANFRTAQFSGEIDVTIKQLVNMLKVARNYSLGGQLLANQTFPDGGYGVYFNLNSADKIQFYAALDEVDNSFAAGEVFDSKTLNLRDIALTELCGLTMTEVTTLPCQTGWENVGGYLEVIFDEAGGAKANFNSNSDFKHVGGVIKSSRTGQQAFFYVSLLGGAVTGNLYDRRD